MVDYSERIAASMKNAGVSVSSLAANLGVSYQAVKKVVDGKSRAFTAENNAKAAAFLRVSPDWLATGSGEMLPAIAPLSSTSTVGCGLSIEQALEVVAAKLNELPSDAREAAAQGLQTLARAPDSAKALQALQATLGVAPPTPMRSIPPIPTAETRDFAPPVPSQFLIKKQIA